MPDVLNPGATPGAAGATPEAGGFREFIATLPEELRGRAGNFADVLDRHSASSGRVTELEAELQGLRSAESPLSHTELLERGLRVASDSSLNEHLAWLKDKGADGYRAEIERLERAASDAEPAKGGSDDEDPRFKALQDRLDKMEQAGKTKAELERSMDAFNIALDKQEVTDPDERALLWELAQGHRHVRGQFGEKLDESAAVKAVRDRRTAWLEAERTKWEQGKQTAAESVADGKPQVTPSTEPPPKEDSGDPGDLDEEKEWEAKMAAKATEVST